MNKLEIKLDIKPIELPKRLKLQYVEKGDAAGIPVILLHGITDSLRSFELTLRSLPSNIRAYAISQRGHGDSDRPDEGYHPRDFAADVAAFMDAQRIDRALIAGHSMGSHMAQRFALDYPNRTLGLALLGSFFSFHGNPALDELSEVVTNLEDPISHGFALEFQLSTLARSVPQDFLDTVVNESLKVPARVWRSALDGLINGDHTADLNKIKAPTLIAWGDQDAFCPRGDQDSFVNAINGARLVVYQGGGHAFHWEEPERFASDLAAFAEGLVESRYQSVNTF